MPVASENSHPHLNLGLGPVDPIALVEAFLGWGPKLIVSRLHISRRQELTLGSFRNQILLDPLRASVHFSK